MGELQVTDSTNCLIGGSLSLTNLYSDHLWESTNVLHQLFSNLNVAYDQIIMSIVDSAQNHIKLTDKLSSQVVEVLKGVEWKNEEAKKKVRLRWVNSNNLYFIQSNTQHIVLNAHCCRASRNCSSTESCLQTRTMIAFILTVSRLGLSFYDTPPNLIMSFIGRGRLNEANVYKDQDLYIQYKLYNVRHFTAPTDWESDMLCKAAAL